MQVSQQEVCREKLLGIRSELLNESLFRGSTGDEIRAMKGDEADQAASEINLNMKLRLRERDQLMVQKIDHALAKLSGGSYGECEGCEDDIGFKRLQMQPFASLCISCKEEQEHNKRFFA